MKKVNIIIIAAANLTLQYDVTALQVLDWLTAKWETLVVIDCFYCLMVIWPLFFKSSVSKGFVIFPNQVEKKLP